MWRATGSSQSRGPSVWCGLPGIASEADPGSRGKPTVRGRAKLPSQTQDDQGRVVGVAVGGEEIGEQGVGQGLGFRVPVFGEGVG